MAFELTRWKTTGASWARGEQPVVVYIPPSTVNGPGTEEEKLPWLPAAAVVGVLGLMFLWTKREAERHSRMAKSSVFASAPSQSSEHSDEEGLDQTKRLPSETMKQIVFGSRDEKVT